MIRTSLTVLVCVGKTCEPKDYGRYYGMTLSFLDITSLISSGTMNFVISFSLLIAIPSSGTMIEKMGTQALSGFLMGVLALGLGCLFASRAVLAGNWFGIKTKI